jgi:hypothetical protein
MNKIIEVRVLRDYHVWLKFHDGFEKTINVRPFIGKGFTQELLDKTEFDKVRIEEGGGIAWENGYGMCPNFLRKLEEEAVDKS